MSQIHSTCSSVDQSDATILKFVKVSFALRDVNSFRHLLLLPVGRLDKACCSVSSCGMTAPPNIVEREVNNVSGSEDNAMSEETKNTNTSSNK